MDLFGQIDLKELGDIIRQQPELVREVTHKDGSVHKYVNVVVAPRRNPDQYGRTHYIKVYTKKEQMRQGVRYYFADLKESQQQGAQAPQKPAPPKQEGQQGGDDNLPF